MKLLFSVQQIHLFYLHLGGYAVVGAAAFTSGVTKTVSTAVIVFEVGIWEGCGGINLENL